MITLYQGPKAWGLPNMSPFGIKVETYLRMIDVPYKARGGDPRKGPTRKIPWIEDDGQLIGDSHFIVEHLRDKFGDTLDAGLTDEQRAIGHVTRRTLEEGAYWAGLYERWVVPEGFTEIERLLGPYMPKLVGPVLLRVMRRQLGRQCWAQGIGRHRRDQVNQLAIADLEAVSALLGDGPFFFGEAPTSIDATVFAFVVSLMWAPFECPLKRAAAELPNLTPYAHRMWDRYFADRPKPPLAN